jgi:hypothetical protein
MRKHSDPFEEPMDELFNEPLLVVYDLEKMDRKRQE